LPEADAESDESDAESDAEGVPPGPAKNASSPGILESLGFDAVPSIAAAAAALSPIKEVKAEPKVKVKGPPKPRAIPIPKDSASFFRARAKDNKQFTFNAEGNLAVPAMRGEPEKVIPLPFYRAATPEEMREKEEKLADQLAKLETDFDENARLLREAIVVWRTTGAASDVIKYQRELTRLDAQRTMLRSPLRWVKSFPNLAIRDVILDNFYEERKIGYPVAALRLRGLAFADTVVGSDKPFVVAVAPEAAGAGEAAPEESFIVFFDPTDPEHGILSPDTAVNFVFNSTKYTNLQQAYEVERVTMLGRKDFRAVILKASTPKQAHTRGSSIVGELENPRELWINILKAAITQDSRFAPVLRATGNDTIVYANPTDKLLGVGLSADDPNILDRDSWTGKNILGQAWQAVRASLPAEEAGAEAGQFGGYTEHAKTQEERREERSKIFRGGAYRRKG